MREIFFSIRKTDETCGKKTRRIPSASLPSHCAALLIVNLDELAEAAGVVVVGRFGIPERLRTKKKKKGYRCFRKENIMRKSR